MLIHLHSQATTTPKVRAAIQASDEPASALASRFGTTEQTVYKWKHRDSVEDRSHTPHRLQTTLTPAQEAVAVALRTALLASLDDLLAVVREFLNPNASRSGLDRCLRRHGVGNLRDLKAKSPTPKHSAFKAYEPGYIHIDVKYLPQMADESSRRYLFVAIDRATRWVFIRVFKSKTAANARRFLRDLERACPLRIRTVLTDNGKEFTDRLFGLRKRAPTGAHEFDTLCAALDIDHRLTPPKSPQTNGMVERFNGRIEEVLQSHHFRSGEELETTLHRYVWLYNQQLPQSALGSKTPLQAMKDWHKLKPELFKKQPYYLPGCDTYIGESEGIGARLYTHNSSDAGRDPKGFWTDTVVLISKDENLTKSHARYVEACLIRAVGSNARWLVPNSKRPSEDAGKLPLPDRAAMEEFVDQTKTLVGALGWDLFREVRGRLTEPSEQMQPTPVDPSPIFFFRGEGFSAEMTIAQSGDFVVKAGSKARARTTPTIPKGTLALRDTLQKSGVLQEDAGSLIFASDYSFTSASAAAATVIGASANGRILWKLNDGRCYADWEAAGALSFVAVGE